MGEFGLGRLGFRLRGRPRDRPRSGLGTGPGVGLGIGLGAGLGTADEVVGFSALMESGVVGLVKVFGELFGAGLREKFGEMVNLSLGEVAAKAVVPEPVVAVFGVAGPETDTEGLLTGIVEVELSRIGDTDTDLTILGADALAALFAVGLTAGVIAVFVELLDTEADGHDLAIVEGGVVDGREVTDDEMVAGEVGNPGVVRGDGRGFGNEGCGGGLGSGGQVGIRIGFWVEGQICHVNRSFKVLVRI